MVNPSELNEAQEKIVEEIRKDPPKPKALKPNVEEFMKDPKAYSFARGITPQGIRNFIIVPTRTQERSGEGTLVEKFVDILRRINFSKAYQAETGSGKLGFKDLQRRAAATMTPADQARFDQAINTGSVL